MCKAKLQISHVKQTDKIYLNNKICINAKMTLPFGNHISPNTYIQRQKG